MQVFYLNNYDYFIFNIQYIILNIQKSIHITKLQPNKGVKEE